VAKEHASEIGLLSLQVAVDVFGEVVADIDVLSLDICGGFPR